MNDYPGSQEQQETTHRVTLDVAITRKPGRRLTLPKSSGVGDGLAVPASEALTTVGFLQIGGGIAGDFPICVVPMLHKDLNIPCPYWGFFCQISDSTASYGSYSGAFPREKISWGKLNADTPMFVVESDASIVAPLLFAWLLEQDW
jgi:hypothetical protein